MSGLFVFLVAFAGIGGKHADKIDKQVAALFDDQVERVTLSKDDRHTLVTRGDGAAEIVKALGNEGVIVGEVDRSGKKPVLRVVVYDADGTMMDLVELTLKKKAKKLSNDNLESVSEVVLADVATLMTPPPPPPEPEPEPDPEPVAEAAPLPDPVAVVSRSKREARFRLSIGGGTRSRTFEPGPAMVFGFRSSQVPGGQIAAELRPLKYVAIAGELDRTLSMHSEVDAASDSVSSSILGWQATVAARLPLGPIELAALGGFGSKNFVLGVDAGPTPDVSYLHALVGGRITAHLGSRVEARAFGAYEPVVGGDDTMMEGAARSGFELGAAVEVGVTPHVFVVGEAGFQRFTSTWEAGSATDDYPGATLSMGAAF